MIPKKEKAVALTTAKKNSLSKSYPKAIPLSSCIQIGSLLLSLAGNEQAEDWRGFQQLLTQFYNGGLS